MPDSFVLLDVHDDPTRLEEVRTLFREYNTFLNTNDCFDSFEEELASLPANYVPPAGCLLLAEVDGKTAGCGAVRPYQEGVCEMRRVYVRPAFRGAGRGRKIVETLIHRARRQGYERMWLDTLPFLTAAIALYRDLGFRVIDPYKPEPIPTAIHFEYVF